MGNELGVSGFDEERVTGTHVYHILRVIELETYLSDEGYFVNDIHVCFLTCLVPEYRENQVDGHVFQHFVVVERGLRNAYLELVASIRFRERVETAHR